MIGPYQVLIDIWEGNIGLDIPAFEKADVDGCIVRLNDMAGGHHMDAHWKEDWAMAAEFPVRAPYFVYNPWVTGQANFDYMASVMPKDYTGRVFIDIEVVYPGYAPKVYADNVYVFLSKAKERWPVSPYTCQGFLPIISYWPKDLDYWWAAYPNFLNGVLTWEEFTKRLVTLDFAYNQNVCPGKVKMWQCSGDATKLPGGGGRAVDINIFPGTLDDLKAWVGVKITPTPAPAPDRNARIKELFDELVPLISGLP